MTISTVYELKNAIRLAEGNQLKSSKKLREQFQVTLASLKPVNPLVETLKEAVSIKGLGKLAAYTAIGLTTGYLSNRIIGGTAATIVRSVLKLILHFRN